MVSVVIPTYNRGSSLEYVAYVLVDYLQTHYSSYEVILVDDASTDHTAKVIVRICKDYPSVKGLILSENVGQQNATLAGIRQASQPLVVTMDDDLRYGLEGIQLLIDTLDKGYKVVYGIPRPLVGSRVRRRGTDLKEVFFRLFCGKPSKIKLTSFRVMSHDLVEEVKKDQATKVYLSAAILQYTKAIANVEVAGEGALNLPSNYTMKKLLKIMWQVFCNYSKPGKKLRLRKVGKQYKVKEIIQ